jgi:N-glycosylase/DNA lyase
LPCDNTRKKKVEAVHLGEEELLRLVEKLRFSEVGEKVRSRIEEFKENGEKGNSEWFSEMCFCILTANSTAKCGLKVQRELGPQGFLSLPRPELVRKLKGAGHRFYNRRADFIVDARKFKNIKDILSKKSNEHEAREWLVENVKGLGYKEASHFLRNLGFLDLAILDRHILAVMRENGLIDGALKPQGKKYLEIEQRLREFAKRAGMSLGELDLYLWYLKTGEVLK